MKIAIITTINGQRQEIQVNGHQTLLEFLRDNLKLKGTVEGCSVGVCGSCTVLIDGKPVALASRSRATSKANKSRPSKACRKTAISTPCSKPFSSTKPSSAAFAPPG